MSDYATLIDLAFSARTEYTVSHPDAISPGFALVINSGDKFFVSTTGGCTMRHKVGQFGLPVEGLWIILKLRPSTPLSIAIARF